MEGLNYCTLQTYMSMFRRTLDTTLRPMVRRAGKRSIMTGDPKQIIPVFIIWHNGARFARSGCGFKTFQGMNARWCDKLSVLIILPRLDNWVFKLNPLHFDWRSAAFKAKVHITRNQLKLKVNAHRQTWFWICFTSPFDWSTNLEPSSSLCIFIGSM